MDWLSEYGFLSWDVAIVALVIIILSWGGWRRMKKSTAKMRELQERNIRDEEIKQEARRQREKKKARR